MPAHVEYQLLSKIVADGNLRIVIDEGITDDHFGVVEARSVFSYLMDYYHDTKTRNLVPEFDLMEHKFPSVEFPTPSERTTIRALCQEVKTEFLRVRMEGVMNQALKTYDENPGGSLARLIQDTKALQETSEESRDLILSDATEVMKREYEMIERAEGMLGIPWPVGWGYHENSKPKILKKTGRQHHPLNEQSGGMRGGDFILLYGRPKCVVEGQPVLSSSGEYVPVENPSQKILALNNECVGWKRCSGSNAGIKNAVRVVSVSGHELEVGDEHPFLMSDLTFRPAAELSVGDYVATAQRVPEVEQDTSGLSEDECALLGYSLGGVDLSRSRHKNLVPKTLQRIAVLNKPEDKRVPVEIFQANNRKIAAFIGAYLDTYGSISCKQHCAVIWTSASKKLLVDVKRLLLRFGITGYLRHVQTNRSTNAYTLTIYSQEQHKILSDHLPLHRREKQDQLQYIAEVGTSKRRSDDGIPLTSLLLETILSAKGSKPWSLVGHKYGINKIERAKTVSRTTLRRLSAAFDSDALLQWAESDVRWEQIKRIDHIGMRPCWDITMEEGEPIFSAGDFLVKNSMKTWCLVDMTVECYYHLNQRVLVFSKEMTPEQLRWRIVARILGVDYTALKSGQLPEEEREEFFELLDTLKSEEERLMRRGHNRSMMVTTGWTSGHVMSGIDSLRSKIEEFEPDIVMADSVYLMKATKKDGGAFWQDIAEIAYGLHDLAVEYRIPIVATSQANRRGEELKGSSMAEIAYGDTFAQACDYAIRIIKTMDDANRTFLSLIFSGAREIKLPGFKLEVEVAQKFMLDQMFESQRQIMAQFKAEEEAIAIEEAKEAAKINTKRKLDVAKFRKDMPEDEK